MRCDACGHDMRLQQVRMDSPVLLGLDEVAAYLRRHVATVRAEIKAGRLALRLVAGAYMATTHQLDAWVAMQSIEEE